MVKSINFTFKYILALFILGCLSLLAYTNLSSLIEQQLNDSKIINLIGKQRMLGQKIYSTVHVYDIEELNNDTLAMEKTHNYLISLEMSDQIKKIFFEKPYNLDSEIKEFIIRSKNIKKNIKDSNIDYIIKNKNKLLNTFDKLTTIYQQESEYKIKKLKLFEEYILVSSLLTLVGIGFFVFRPANKIFEKRAKEITDEKDYSNIIIESNTNAIIAVGKDLKVKTFNKAAEKIFGYSKKEMIGYNSLLKIVPSMDHKAHIEGISNHFKTGIFKHKGSNLELEAVKKNGDTFPIRISFGEDENATEQERLVIANIQDISVEKEKERLFMTNEKIYKDLFELNKLIILLINPTNGDIINANKSAVDFYGYEKSKFLTLNICDISTLPMNKIEEVMNLAVKNEKSYFQFIHILSNNEHRNVKVNSTPTIYKNEIVLYTIITDITDEVDVKNKFLSLKEEFKDFSKMSKEELEKINTFLSEGQKIANIGNWEFDLINNKLTYSDQVYRILGAKPQEFEPTYDKFLSFVHSDDRQNLHDTYTNSLKENRPYYIEYRVINKDGLVRYVEESCIHKYDENNNIIKSIGVIHDITEIKEKDKLISQQSKMAAMGEMIENIAHQWRQPLSVISTASSGIMLESEMNILKEDNVYTAMSNIHNSAKYLSQTIDDFRDFYKVDKKKEKFIINKTFEKTFTLIESQFKNSNITIIKNIVDANLLAYENELIQVLINILNNARDELIKKEENAKFILIDTLVNNNILEIFIKDNAGGIPEDVIDKVFTSHFTTKHDSNGTGIGLYMSKMIIEEHLNGTIDVNNTDFIYENNSYYGAEFKISLPIFTEK